MRFYIAGPMTGYEHYNFPSFFAVQRLLEGMGHQVRNPAAKEATPEGYPDPAKIPVEWGGSNADIHPGDIRKRDLEEMYGCDGVVLLPGWIDSWGAKLEAATAQAIGLKLWEVPTLNGPVCFLPPELLLRVMPLWSPEGFTDEGNTGLKELKSA